MSDYLRYERGLTGTKVVCAEGDCGACAVLRWVPSAEDSEGPPLLEPVNSCITTVAQLDGCALVTVEALEEGEKLSPVQEAMVRCHGSQCGFCTPGFVVSLTALAERRCRDENLRPIHRKEAQNYLTGNLCRCTGYEPILAASEAIDLKRYRSLAQRFVGSDVQQTLAKVRRKGLLLESDEFSFFAPLKAVEAARFLTQHKGARILGASTDLGVAVNKRRLRYGATVSLHLCSELYGVKATAKRGEGELLWVGARVTLAQLRRQTEARIPDFSRFLDLFASPLIKNAATLVGNLANASPIGDTLPFLLVTGARVEVQGPKASRMIPIEKFFLGYRKTALKPGEVITRVGIEIPGSEERLELRKASQRKDLDISAVNAAFRLKMNGAGDRVEDIRLALGGVGPVPLRLERTERLLRGRVLGELGWSALRDSLQQDISPQDDLRGTAAFRRKLAENYLLRFLRGISPDLAPLPWVGQP